MAKVTSKYQVTVPRAIADHYRIRPGDEIDWIPAGDAIRVLPTTHPPTEQTRETRLRIFDQATERLHNRPQAQPVKSENRGWTRQDLYGRGRTR